MNNKQLILQKRPNGFPQEDTWVIRETPLGQPAEGEILVQNLYISLDPAMRGWINDTRSYIPPVPLNEVMRAGSIGKIVKSNNHPHLKEGQWVTGWGGAQQYVQTSGEDWFPVSEHLAPLSKYLGVLGMPGMTAYFGIFEVGKIKKGDVVLISGAAGAVGSVAGQLAKIQGCNVIGIAGGPEKCRYLLEDLKFDAVIDYKNEDVTEALRKSCPKGIDVYFDNVGGEILDAALTRLRKHARIVICGAISQYNQTEVKGPDNYLSLLINRATMQGMVVMDYAPKFGEAAQRMGKWMAEGKLQSREDIYQGIENFYPTFKRLFNGEKKGKLLLQVTEEEIT